MVRKKIDNRIRILIENGVAFGHRTLFVIVGDKGRDQIVILHHMLSKASVKARPTVLWCYKKELGFSSHRKKRMKSLQKKIESGKLNVNEDDPFELFVVSTNIRYCYYSETHKILGNTFGMCILQDFEAITPNLLARTIETVEGGGIIAILLKSLTSLKQLYTLSMDIHERYRTEAHNDVIGRFNERFILSLATCDRCLVVDDQLTVLPISSQSLEVKAINKPELSENDKQLADLKETLRDTQPVSSLLNCCRTLDQGKALLKFIEAISEKSLRSTVSLTASRGRGKSAALGLAVAAAVAFNYSNIFVTSPSPENLNTFFEFVFKGFDALEYQEHLDYDLIQSTNPDYNKAIVRVNIFRDHRQTIQYLHPNDGHKLGHAELVVIDEAAAIPLPLVKSMLGSYLVFLASTINGYEGTGRSLSLKLLQQLRNQTISSSLSVKIEPKTGSSKNTTSGRVLHEISLEEPIRYRPGDAVEKWLLTLLCLDTSCVQPIQSGYPTPENCDLYYINRDTLFCFHTASEAFLQRLMALYVASHYKNTPNDLQMLSDAPAHHLFCLLGPIDAHTTALPEVIVIIQVCLEGKISKRSVNNAMIRGKKAAGDLIPWTIAQQYQDEDFPMLSGARIVRIATHPDYQGMGYGSRALSLLQDYYSNKLQSLDEQIIMEETLLTVEDDNLGLLEEYLEPKKILPPLLVKLSERLPEHLDYIGVSFGLTQELYKFWKRADFIPVYIRQTKNDLTGEHSCILLKSFQEEKEKEEHWLNHFSFDFRRRFMNLLSSSFRFFSSSLALSVLHRKNYDSDGKMLTKDQLDFQMTSYDLKRLEMYSNNLMDYHLILDLMPTLAKFYFSNLMGKTHLSAVQATITLGIGLQHKTIDEISAELNLQNSQILGLFNKSIRKFVEFLNSVLEKNIEVTFTEIKSNSTMMTPTTETVAQDLEKTAKKMKEKQKKELEKLKKENLTHYVIKGSENEWSQALATGNKSIVSIKSGETFLAEAATTSNDIMESLKKGKKRKKNFK